MNIYFIRHADALPQGSEGVTSDEDRPLSKIGHTQTERLARALRRLDLPLEKILSSPLLRAHQTAEQLMEHLKLPNLELLPCDELAPGGSSRKLAKFLRRLSLPHLFLVGHEPDLGRHTAWLIGSKRARIEFAKGGVACVACDNPPRKGEGSLVWLLTPAWME